MRPTICALSSPADPALRAVVRLSGARTAAILARCVTVDGEPLALAARGVYAARLDDGRGSQPVDVWWMPGPASYTREDTAELHVVGSPFLVDAVLARLFELGCEPAGPGEFTRRAFENGRFDLTQAEGVLELVGARSEDERRAGLLLFEGGLSERVDALRDELEDVRALCEASLDFDEAETGHVPTDELGERTARALARLDDARGGEDRRAPVGRTPRVVLAGAPNAGKSTLFNALTDEQALVADEAGTTRDQLRATWSVAGVDVELFDAPGVEVGRDAIERKAAELARRTRASAELLLVVVAATDAGDATELARELAMLPNAPRVLAWSQIDRPGAAPEPSRAWLDALEPQAAVALSAVTGAGLAALERAVARALGLTAGEANAGARGAAREGVEGSLGTAPASAAAAITLRHRHALERSRSELERAAEGLAAGAPLDLVAEALRAATDELDAITGRTAPDDLLDRIFARFCIGK